MANKWEKRWSFSNNLYYKDYVISELKAPSTGYHLEQVDANGRTIKHIGNYSRIEAAMNAAEEHMRRR